MRIIFFKYCIIFFAFFSCQKNSQISITKNYIEIIKPGQSLGFFKLSNKILNNEMLDTVESNFSVLDKIYSKQILGNSKIKIDFYKNNKKYNFEEFNKDGSRNIIDNLIIEKNVLYKIDSDKYPYFVYFKIDSPLVWVKNIIKPDIGPW